MAKIIEYPRASFKNSLELAKAVSELGGSCSQETCADHMNRKVSGAFSDLIGATKKFGFLDNIKGQLKISELYENYEQSYNDEEKIENLRLAFFNIGLFEKVFEKYKSQKLPENIFDKILIREYDVNKADASRVKKYFIDAAKEVKLLNPDFTFNELENKGAEDEKGSESENNENKPDQENTLTHASIGSNPENYTITIIGPSINQVIEVVEIDHLDLVEAVLGIIRKKINSKTNHETN